MADLSTLSPRQRECMDLAVRGEPNKVIARELGIDIRTVRAHVSEGMHRIGAKNRTHAAFLIFAKEAA